MSTPAQIAANKENAQHSSGPKTEAGKAASSINNFRHGLAGSFMIMDWENREDFDELFDSLRAEHKPTTPTEALLVESMTQHYWLRTRALKLQHVSFRMELPQCEYPAELALYLRYQITHERAFHKALNDLLKLRAEKRKAVIGFESSQLRQRAQAHRETAAIHRQANENRKKELHKWRVSRAEAQAEHQLLANAKLKTPETLASRTRRAGTGGRKGRLTAPAKPDLQSSRP